MTVKIKFCFMHTKIASIRVQLPRIFLKILINKSLSQIPLEDPTVAFFVPFLSSPKKF